MSLVGEYTVTYRDTDVNGHMNNTNYADILCGCIPNMKQLRVKSIGINYSSEAVLNEELKIYMSKIDGKFYFRTIRSDGKTNIEAEIITERLD
jgi:acyl-ACP thioesterase